MADTHSALSRLLGWVALATALLAAAAIVVRAAEPRATAAAEGALAALVAAYEAGDALQVDERVDTAMAGRGALMQKVRDSLNAQRQIRISLADREAIADGDIVFLHARWEKRFLALPAMKPGLASGRLSAVMKRSGGAWKLAGLLGDNPFAAGLP